MQKKSLGKLYKYIIPLFILLGFALFFTYDIYSLKKYFIHSDFKLYFPFRQWFLQRMSLGVFPLWNPYWGIGQPAESWATIPVDIYTILEIIFGPQYSYFQVVQLILVLLAGFFAFLKLGFKPVISALGTLLFFLSPWVTYFYFYFMHVNSFIAYILLFIFIYLWFDSKNKKYIFLIIWTTIFSMFGTKPELWFYQSVSCIALSLISAFIFYSNKPLESLKMILSVILAMALGILAHTWQLNIIIRTIINTTRINPHSIFNLFNWEMYHNLFVSIVESELLKMLVVALLFYLGIRLKKRLSLVFLILGILTAFITRIWQSSVIISFLKSPFLYGPIVGIILSLLFTDDFRPKDYVKAGLLFPLLIYYWCRPGRGDLGEMEIMRLAPVVFKILYSIFIWLACMQIWRNKLAKLCYLSILFVFLIRDQGQIILSYLSGILWIPTRDNYIIDFALSILAAIGFSELVRMTKLSNYNKWEKKWETVEPLPIFFIAVVILSCAPNFYYSHWMMKKTPPGYPYQVEKQKLLQVIKTLHDLPAARIYYLDDNLSYGFGISLQEKIGQVVEYGSLIPKNYWRWNIYHELGIRPKVEWGGYPGEYTDKTISRLPKQNNLGFTNTEVYSHTLLARPALKNNVLKLLGVKYIVQLSSLSEKMIGDLDLKDIEEREEISYPGMEGALITARIDNTLPRAFLVYGVTNEKIDEFSNEMDPVIKERSITTKTLDLSLASTYVEKYEPEYISVIANSKEDAYLVLSDLNHPFWHAKLDGREADIIPAFYIFRAVKVSPGVHRVEFYCQIPYFTESLSISLLVIILTFFTTIGYFIFPFRFRKVMIRSKI